MIQNLEEYDLLQCIDRGLDPFGSHVKQTIYWRMAILHGSSQGGIVANADAFARVLEDLFGDTAEAKSRCTGESA